MSNEIRELTDQELDVVGGGSFNFEPIFIFDNNVAGSIVGINNGLSIGNVVVSQHHHHH
jgi:hypothetical protein